MEGSGDTSVGVETLYPIVLFCPKRLRCNVIRDIIVTFIRASLGGELSRTRRQRTVMLFPRGRYRECLENEMIKELGNDSQKL